MKQRTLRIARFKTNEFLAHRAFLFLLHSFKMLMLTPWFSVGTVWHKQFWSLPEPRKQHQQPKLLLSNSTKILFAQNTCLLSFHSFYYYYFSWPNIYHLLLHLVVVGKNFIVTRHTICVYTKYVSKFVAIVLDMPFTNTCNFSKISYVVCDSECSSLHG